MNIAIFSDIHENLPNLERALKLIKNKKKVDLYMFLGDVVGYSLWSNVCVEIIENIKNALKVKGNHEEYFIKKKCNSTNELTKLFFEQCFKNFKHTKEIKKYKKNNIFIVDSDSNKWERFIGSHKNPIEEKIIVKKSDLVCVSSLSFDDEIVTKLSKNNQIISLHDI